MASGAMKELWDIRIQWGYIGREELPFPVELK